MSIFFRYCLIRFQLSVAQCFAGMFLVSFVNDAGWGPVKLTQEGTMPPTSNPPATIILGTLALPMDIHLEENKMTTTLHHKFLLKPWI